MGRFILIIFYPVGMKISVQLWIIVKIEEELLSFTISHDFICSYPVV